MRRRHIVRRGRPSAEPLPRIMPSTWTPLDGAWSKPCQRTRWRPRCRNTAAWRRMWKTGPMPAPAFDYLCDPCRRAIVRFNGGRVHPDLLRLLALSAAIAVALVYVARH